VAYYHNEAYDAAIADYNKAIQLNPNLAVAYNNRAQAYLQKKDYNKAEENVRRAQSLKYPVDQEILRQVSGSKR
jgi:tetratricopeptide (TPR) repeat protein